MRAAIRYQQKNRECEKCSPRNWPLLTPHQLKGEINDELQVLTEAMAALREENEYFGELYTIARVLAARLKEIG